MCSSFSNTSKRLALLNSLKTTSASRGERDEAMVAIPSCVAVYLSVTGVSLLEQALLMNSFSSRYFKDSLRINLISSVISKEENNQTK